MTARCLCAIWQRRTNFIWEIRRLRWRERVEVGKNQVSSRAIIIHNNISWAAVNRPARKVSMPSRYEVVWTIIHPITTAAMKDGTGYNSGHWCQTHCTEHTTLKHSLKKSWKSWRNSATRRYMKDLKEYLIRVLSAVFGKSCIKVDKDFNKCCIFPGG